jgi:RNA 2',3'-cyclic 3'-phosphodiesterase
MSDSAAKLRLFFALKPDPSEWGGLGEATRSLLLKPGSLLVPRSNYHLTLAFIGEVAASQLSILQEIGARQVAPALALKFDAFEYWPKPEVVVAAARTIPEGLQVLWQRLHDELAVHQWALDAKRLRPHVTLARKVSQAPVLQAMSPVNWVAREFCLMRSQLGGAQPAYTVVDTWPLLYDSEKQ